MLTPPTAAAFKERFPIFGKLTKEHIDGILIEALAYVDETWVEPDRDPALMYMAAHLLVREGALAAGQAGVVNTLTRGPVTSVRVGDVSTTYGGEAAGGSGSGGAGGEAWLLSTEYGKRFARLRRRSFPAVFVV